MKKTTIIIIVIVGVIVMVGLIAAALIGIRTYNVVQKQQTANKQASTVPQTVEREGVDMCKLIPASKASDIVGETVATKGPNTGEPTSSSLEMASLCEYFATDSLTRVSMRSHTPGTSADSDTYPPEAYDTQKASISDKVAVSGIGDDAYWSPSSASLTVKQGDSYFSFSVLTSDSDSQKPKSEALAKAALAAL